MKPNALLASLATTATAVGMKPSPAPRQAPHFPVPLPLQRRGHGGLDRLLHGVRDLSRARILAPRPRSGLLQGLHAWIEGLKGCFLGWEYHSGWVGWDKHLHDWSIVYMEYSDVPLKVREWI